MWDKSLVDFEEDIIEALNATRIDISIDMLNALVDLAPVDTSRYVSNMNVSIDAPDYAYSETARLGRSGARARGRAQLPRKYGKVLQNTYITNSTPYGGDLEKGSSPQARSGVFTVAFLGVATKYGA